MIKCESVIKMNNNEIFNMYFGIIEDPRCEVNVIHPLVNILKLVMIQEKLTNRFGKIIQRMTIYLIVYIPILFLISLI